MKFKGIIFDLDGTLIDTLNDLSNAANRILKKNGFPVHDKESYRYFIGNGVRNLIRRALPDDRQDNRTIETCLEEFLYDYNKNAYIDTHPYDGIQETLEHLNSRGIKMAVLSNKHDFATKECARRFFPGLPLNPVFGQREGVPIKPDPYSALEIARQHNLQPTQFIFLGDSNVDMEIGIAAGMYPVGALWGFRTRDELIKSGAKDVIERPEYILKFFEP